MEPEDASLSEVAYLMVVQRDHHDRFRFLRSTFAERSVEVVWDRRSADRRKSSEGPAVDRRSGDRRHEPPASWSNLGFLVARSSGGRAGR
jgi:hypothetical protein